MRTSTPSVGSTRPGPSGNSSTVAPRSRSSTVSDVDAQTFASWHIAAASAYDVAWVRIRPAEQVHGKPDPVVVVARVVEHVQHHTDAAAGHPDLGEQAVLGDRLKPAAVRLRDRQCSQVSAIEAYQSHVCTPYAGSSAGVTTTAEHSRWP